MRLLVFLLLSLCAMAGLLLTQGQTAGAYATSPTAKESPPLGSTSWSGAAPVEDCTRAYTYTVSAGSVALSNNLLPGSQCTNCVVPLELPFEVSLYGRVYTETNVSTTGNIQFLTAANPYQSCPAPYTTLGPSILPYWNTWLDTGWNDPCQGAYGAPCGVFTTLTGSFPNRTFKIEWRARYEGSNTEVVDFEIRFYESSEDFDFVYGSGLMFGNTTSVGVQDGAGQYTTYACDVSGNYQFHTIHWTPIFPLPCEPTPTPTGMPTSTRTQTFTATDTSVPTASPTATASNTSIPTATYTQMPPTSTFTPGMTASSTSTPGMTASSTSTIGTATETATSVPASDTPTPHATASATPTVCKLSFWDVPPGSTFYPYVQCLACLGIVDGYPDGTYKPNNSVTRGQAAKILANSAGFDESIPANRQTFADVPAESTFWLFIERISLHGAISGYPCGGPAEPCPGTYFRPQSTLTRAQAAKIVSVTAGFADTIPSDQQTFSDVPPESTFWRFIERDALHGVINGYFDGAFRPQNVTTRGQLAKIASLAFLTECTR